MKKIIAFCFFLTLIGCHKEKDTVTQQAVNGMVYNQCTDSGLAGVTVYLKVLKDNAEVKSYQTLSGSNGNFSFEGVDIHSDSKYSYAIDIPSKSGIGATTPEYCGFDGTTLTFTKDQASDFFNPKVVPKFLYLCYTCSISFPIIQPDSINITFQQRIFHKNVSNLPYSGQITNHSTLSSCSSNYPMGLWSFSIRKWKSGVYSETTDSIYIGWGGAKTYTINW